MNSNQVAWARQHDWFVAIATNGQVGVWDSEQGVTLWFTDYHELRAWAGY